ncbi:esterase/lipase family protein [Massilia glaciei]|uniref:GPI inositol-deacylase PGAP1-like alpha/beta domain-containing protein n=1 Tax=Massilia glaciei TaxID=1524097 RepID=A0A2U2HNW0_9BURK|nr:hypothetical protein [Massilia glaciei]PWF49142.1 hypothetical protein C7C56_008135 [Massilia glaciei]
MTDEYNFPGYKLPVNPYFEQGTIACGFVTPKQDRIPQVQSIPPRRVLPIIFIPGIMGSNLRMSAARQAQLEKDNNISWRPEHTLETLASANDTAEERQLRLDPDETEVDTYDPVRNPTGDPDETSDERNEEVEVDFSYKVEPAINPPLLRSDPRGTSGRRTSEQKARARGWGEVYFDSYRELLEMCEERLNTAFYGGKMDSWWKKIIDVAPAKWGAHAQPVLAPLDEATLRAAVKGCWFPVHAMGYNWLKGNEESGTVIANRIRALMKNYEAQGFQCEKVILITHSMGGLVARAAIHPAMGGLNDKVLGIVHGVMPAIGAGAAYKRMRCGFEGSGITTDVLGSTGAHVTPVLGNAQGGLELLPSQAYGNDWLRVQHTGKIIKSLPEKGDPYEEIYKVKGKWFNLLQEGWINPARQRNSSFENTCHLLDLAKKFHSNINETYHDQSYAHYGAGAAHPAWRRVVWAVDDRARVVDVNLLNLVADDRKGVLTLVDPRFPSPVGQPGPRFTATMSVAADPGDQTVPLHSAEHQLRSGKFKGIFRQHGYEHQASYSDESALFSTLFSVVRIAYTMGWSK